MTPEEKAKELVFELIHKTEPPYKKATFEQSRMCALICVDEILDLQLELAHDDAVNDIAEFYKKVRKELQNL